MSSWSDKLFVPTCIGGFVLIHWAWWKIQENPNLVRPEERKPHPAIEAWYYWTHRKEIAEAAAARRALEPPEEPPGPRWIPKKSRHD